MYSSRCCSVAGNTTLRLKTFVRPSLYMASTSCSISVKSLMMVEMMMPISMGWSRLTSLPVIGSIMYYWNLKVTVPRKVFEKVLL